MNEKIIQYIEWRVTMINCGMKYPIYDYKDYCDMLRRAKESK